MGRQRKDVAHSPDGYGSARTANLTVTAIEPQQTQTIATVSGNYTVRVANFGERESDPAQLQVFIGDAAQPAAMVPSVPPGQSVEVPIEAAFPSEGFETLTVELGRMILRRTIRDPASRRSRGPCAFWLSTANRPTIRIRMKCS